VTVKALQLRERGSVVVSARTGEGLPELATAIEDGLPERDRLVRVSVPYARGDLVARAHAAGEVTRSEHGPDGTFLEARVPPELAAELRPYAVQCHVVKSLAGLSSCYGGVAGAASV
jgi:GTP-binding protein HflX